jgi:hypothetical protein
VENKKETDETKLVLGFLNEYEPLRKAMMKSATQHLEDAAFNEDVMDNTQDASSSGTLKIMDSLRDRFSLLMSTARPHDPSELDVFRERIRSLSLDRVDWEAVAERLKSDVHDSR